MEDQFAGVDSGMFADALDQLGFDGGMIELKSVTPGARFYGKAATFKMLVGRAGAFESNDIALGKIVEAASAGDVVVVDVGGAPICAWGELVSLAARAKGVVGVLVDGAVRDAEAISAMGFPVLAKYANTPIAGKTRLRLVSVNDAPVNCGGVAVTPGDYVFGDTSGAVVVPQGMEQETLPLVFKARDREEAFKRNLEKGMSYFEAAQELGLRQM